MKQHCLVKDSLHKIIFAAAIVFLILTVSQLNTNGQTTSVVVSPVSQTVNGGNEVLASINVIDAQDLYSCQISLSYDSNILEFQGVLEGDFLNEKGSANTFHIDPKLSPGQIKGYAISRVGVVPGVNGNGNLAIFRFTATASGNSPITIATNPVGILGTKLLNSQPKEIAYTKTDGAVIVSSDIVTKPQIVLNKQVDNTISGIGRTLLYTITYKNIGSQEAKNVVILDPIPQRTVYVDASATNGAVLLDNQLMWNIDSVAPNATGSVSFQVQITN